MKILDGLSGHEKTLRLEHEDVVKLVPPLDLGSDGCLHLLVFPTGRLLILCELGSISKISGPGMKGRVSEEDPFLPEHFSATLSWEALMRDVKTPIMPVLVPAGGEMSCVYLSLDDKGRFEISGGASIIQEIVGREIAEKITE